MAISREEVTASIGIDHSKVKTGLKSASSDIKAWGKSVQEQVAGDSAAAGFLFENSFKKTFKSLKKLFAINLISAAGDFLQFWDTATKTIADSFVTKESESIKENTALWHKAMDERDARAKEGIKARAEYEAQQKEFRELRDRNVASGVAERIAKAGGDDTEKGRRIMREFLHYQKQLADYEVQTAKNRSDALAIEKAETAQHEINIRLFQFENKLLQDAINLRDKKMRETAATGKYDSTLKEIVALEADAARRTQIASQGHFVGDIFGPGGGKFVAGSGFDPIAQRELLRSTALRAGIKADLLKESTVQKTPEQKVLDQLIGSINRNMKNGKIPVAVEVEE